MTLFLKFYKHVNFLSRFLEIKQKKYSRQKLENFYRDLTEMDSGFDLDNENNDNKNIETIKFQRDDGEMPEIQRTSVELDSGNFEEDFEEEISFKENHKVNSAFIPSKIENNDLELIEKLELEDKFDDEFDDQKIKVNFVPEIQIKPNSMISQLLAEQNQGAPLIIKSQISVSPNKEGLINLITDQYLLRGTLLRKHVLA